MKRLFFVLIVCIGWTTMLFGQSAAWEGRAAIGNKRSFPKEGDMGITRVFPVGEMITVTNKANGKSVTVVVSQNANVPGVLITLSPSAAQKIGLTGGVNNDVILGRPEAEPEEIPEPPPQVAKAPEPEPE
ncbi:MAG: hypothetical protein IIW10_04410, partial [Spirochaetaceae bacterium]|nr:hypothetical protein [Spirochaetaceae bacterium]